MQLLVSGQTTTNSASSPASGGGSLSPGGASGPGGHMSPGGSNSGPGTQCCESGRPLVTDPVTGQSVCSCQYDSARLAALQYPRSVGVYGTPYPSTDQNPYPSIGVDSSAFYSPLVSWLNPLFKAYLRSSSSLKVTTALLFPSIPKFSAVLLRFLTEFHLEFTVKVRTFALISY